MIFIYYLITYGSIILATYYLAHVEEKKQLDISPSLIILMMRTCDKGGIFGKTQFYLVMGMFIFQIPSLLIICNTIFVKKSSDILQGISKLDYLLKVSYFQRYKDPEKEKRKWTLLTESMDQGSSDRYSEQSKRYGELMKRLSSVREATFEGSEYSGRISD